MPPPDKQAPAPHDALDAGLRAAPPPRAKGRGGSGAGIAIAAVVGLGVLGAAGFGAYKFMGAESLSATPCGRGTLSLIGSLKSPVTVTFYVTGGTPALDKFAAEVTRSMTDLEQSAKGKLVYKTALVTSDAVAAEAREAGLQEQAFAGDAEGKDPSAFTIRRGFCGMVLSYGSEREAIPYLAPTLSHTLPFWVAGKIRELRARADDVASRFGVVTSKGGVSFSEGSLVARDPSRSSPTIQSVFAQSLPYYRLEDLDLHGGEAEIDPTYSGVIVLQPAADFTDKELRRIDQFLMRGKKSVVVIASAVNVKGADPQMSAELSTHGLERLLDGYGIEMAKDMVQDLGHEVEMSFSTTTGNPVKLRLPGVLLVKHDDAAQPSAQPLDTSFVPFFRLDEMIFPFPSSLVLHPEKQPGARLSAVARSSPTAMTFSKGPILLNPIRAQVTPGDPGPRLLAASLEGKIKSAFAGRPGDGVSAPESAPEDSRLFVLSAAQFPVNPLARAANPLPQPPQMAMLGTVPTDDELAMLAQPYAQRYLTTTLLALKNTFDWAAADDATVSCSALLTNNDKDPKPR